ncbi:MAG: hypothetical protein AB1801_17055, partial [Chloroflexota bacterium]
ELKATAAPTTVNLAGARPAGPHRVLLAVLDGPVRLDGYIIEGRPVNWAGSGLLILAVLAGLGAIRHYRRNR